MHANQYLQEVSQIAQAINPEEIESMAAALSKVDGRIYMVGLGGSLANCMHMAADLRKLCHLEAVAPDNLAELTAWANDESFNWCFKGFLSNLSDKDAIFVLSVGGGDFVRNVSLPIVNAIIAAQGIGAKVFGIVGPNGGATFQHGHYVIKIPAPKERQTPHTEAFQAVVWHALVSHPLLQKAKTKW